MPSAWVIGRESPHLCKQSRDVCLHAGRRTRYNGTSLSMTCVKKLHQYFVDVPRL